MKMVKVYVNVEVQIGFFHVTKFFWKSKSLSVIVQVVSQKHCVCCQWGTGGIFCVCVSEKHDLLELETELQVGTASTGIVADRIDRSLEWRIGYLAKLVLIEESFY